MSQTWSPSLRRAASAPRNSKGFSLTEVIVAMTIATFVLVAATAMFIQFSKTNLTMAARADFDRQMRTAIQLLAEDTRVAANSSQTDSTNITLTMPSSNTPQLVYYTYNPNAKTLSRAEDSGADRVILNNLNTFRITVNDDAVTYMIRFSKDVGDRNITLDRDLTFRMRNK